MRQGHSMLGRIMKLTIGICIKYNVYREERYDVTLPWWQNFRISTIFLARDGRLHCRTMKGKYGLSFCPECNH